MLAIVWKLVTLFTYRVLSPDYFEEEPIGFE